MGLLSFIKEAGEKLLHTVEGSSTGDPAAANQAAADTIKSHIAAQGIDTSKLQTSFDAASHTVALTGSVSDQVSQEKTLVTAGNVQGVETVNHEGLSVDNPAPAATFHDVKSGDTLSAVAKEVYGDAAKYHQIFEANKPMLSSPDRIYPGQKLVIPALSS